MIRSIGVLVVVLLLAACSGGDGGGETTPGRPEPAVRGLEPKRMCALLSPEAVERATGFTVGDERLVLWIEVSPVTPVEKLTPLATELLAGLRAELR